MKKSVSSSRGGQSSSAAKKSSTAKGSSTLKKTVNILDGETSPRNKSIRREEVKQLEQFVKKRSQELDHEILSLRDKLKNTSTLPQSSTLDRSYKTKAFVGSVENDTLQHLVGESPLNVRGSGVNKVSLDPTLLMEESRQHANEFASQSKKLQHQLDQIQHEKQGNLHDHKDHLVSFLAKLRLSKLIFIDPSFCVWLYLCANLCCDDAE